MTAISLSISEVNNLPSDHFIKIFGNVVEHYPAAAIGILKNRPFTSAEDVSEAIDFYLDALHRIEKEKILQLHPDLAGKLAETGNLTRESKAEQLDCGLDQITSEEKAKLGNLNELYRKKFQFPFVTCARENKLQTILSSVENRMLNDAEQELTAGIEEVKKISKLRIYQIINK